MERQPSLDILTWFLIEGDTILIVLSTIFPHGVTKYFKSNYELFVKMITA